MPDWLQDSFKIDHELSWITLLLRLLLSLVLGAVVAGVYHFTLGRHRRQTESLMATLVLLTLVIAMITLVIGNSVARAFSLVGALAIVRFRTVVEDTRDTAFVIFAVGVGMAVGAGFFLVPILAIPFAATAVYLFRPAVIPVDSLNFFPFTVNIRIGLGFEPDKLLHEVFGKHVSGSRLTAVATARQGAALDLTYSIRLLHEHGELSFIAELNKVEGVQQVELRCN